MTIEGNVGADHSLFSSAADNASALARAQAGAVGTLLATIANPQGAHYAAPTALTMAAGLVTIGAGGLFIVSFNFYFTDSAPDTISVAPFQQNGATAVSGGTVAGGFNVDEGSTVTVVGGAPTTIETLTKSVTTGGLTNEISGSFASFGTPGTKTAIGLSLTAGHTLTAMTLNIWVLQV